MSASPTRDTDAEPEPEVAQDSNDGGDQQGDPGESGDATTQEVAMYETEVKEQDRWLPIANGMEISSSSRTRDFESMSFTRCFTIFEFMIMLLSYDHVTETTCQSAIFPSPSTEETCALLMYTSRGSC